MSDIFKKISSIETDNNAMDRDSNITPIEPTYSATRPPMPNADTIPKYISQETHYKAVDRADPLPSFRWVMPTAIGVSLLWVASVYAIIFGFFGGQNVNFGAAQWVGLVLLTIVPVLIISVTAFACKQLAKISSQAQQLSAVSAELTQPDEAAVGKTAIMSRAIAEEVDGVNAKVNTAVGRLAALKDFIDTQNEKLDQSSLLVNDRVERIDNILSKQQDALSKMADIFDERMTTLSERLTEHTDILEHSAIMSDKKIQEARDEVDQSVNKLTEATDKVRENASQAASALTTGHNDIEELGTKLREKSDELEAAYQKHAQDIAEMIGKLNSDQTNLGSLLEERLTKLTEMSNYARTSADTLTTASKIGWQTVEALGQAAKLSDTAIKKQFSDLEDMVAYSNNKAEHISLTASNKVRESLAQSRKEILRIENDMVAMQNRLKEAAEARPAPTPMAPPISKEQLGRLSFTSIDDNEATSSDNLQTTLNLQSEKPHDNFSESIDLESISDQAIDNTENLALTIEPVDVEKDLKPAKTEDVLTSLVTNNLEPASASSHQEKNIKNKKEKQGWKWRDMLSGLERPDVEPVTDNQDEDFISTLWKLGLAPSAIVDDGCIIEASQARTNNGIMAMSHVVTTRLSDPVQHLFEAMENDAALKTNAKAFTQSFGSSVANLETDQDSLRSHLASEKGRAYLLCNAALNI